jgi:hypothetical protein
MGIFPVLEDVPERIGVGIGGIADGDDGVAVPAQVWHGLVPLNDEGVASGGDCAEGCYAAKDDGAVVVASGFVGGEAGNLHPIADELGAEFVEGWGCHWLVSIVIAPWMSVWVKWPTDATALEVTL